MGYKNCIFSPKFSKQETAISQIENEIEFLTIKKIEHNRYVLYGLMRWGYIENGVPTKSLVSIKSNNLIWKFDVDITQDSSEVFARGGSNNIIVHSFLLPLTKKILYQFELENITNSQDDILVTFTILNKRKDGFMEYNIYEGLENYVIEVNVAGVKKEEIKVVLEDEIIKIRTNPKARNLEDFDTKLEMFEPIKSETEVYLPNINEVEKAELKDGVLTLTVPKASKGIEVKIS